MKHLGRELRLEEGDFAVVDTTLPYSVRYEDAVRRIVVNLPREEFVRRGLATDTVCGRVFNGRLGTSGLASRILRMLDEGATELAGMPGHSMASTLLDLIAESESEDGAKARPAFSRTHGEIIRSVRGIVLANLSDPDLSVPRVAQMAGISVRYLHKLFGATGTTLREWIEAERLARAYANLKNPMQKNRSIQEIAFGVGFNDSGYFSHRFVRKYGKTPSQARSEGD